jgi:hypothetical protein
MGETRPAYTERRRRVRRRKTTLVSIPSSQPRTAATRMIQTSEAWPLPTTQLSFTWRVFRQDDGQGHEAKRPGVEPGAVAVSPESFDARLDTFRCRQRWRRVRFDLHLFLLRGAAHLLLVD